MNRPELYKNTVDVLFNAYFNDTLEHGNCYACAVGNIIASKCGFRFEKYIEPFFIDEGTFIHVGLGSLIWDKEVNLYDNPVWFLNYENMHRGKLPSDKAILKAKSTGYSWEELEAIEYSFEEADRDEVLAKEVAMFNGLCNVLEALKKIHEITEETNDVDRFAEHYKTKQLIEQ